MRRIIDSDFHGDMSEAELKRLVVGYARLHGWAVYHVPMTTMRNGGGSGYPDLTLARDGEVLWMELKTETGVLSKLQGQWIEALPFAHIIRPSQWNNGRVAELLA